MDETAVKDSAPVEKARPVNSRLGRWFLLVSGFVSLGLGIIGIFLPVLPTTPFLLLAAACFARASQRFYDWLLNNRVFGEYIYNWRAEKAIAARHKLAAINLIVITGGASIVFFISLWQVKLVVGLVCLAVIILVLSFKTKRLPRLASIRAVVFDLDGTLLDTLSDIGNSMNAVLQGQGEATHKLKAYHQFVGSGMANLVKKAMPEKLQNDEEIFERFLKGMKEEYARQYQNQSHSYKGIVAMLGKLKARQIKMAVLSNKPHEYTTSLVESKLPAGIFESVYGVKEDIPLKPDPGGLLKVCSELGVKPEETIYLGDTGSDMTTALRAGAYPVAVSWGFRQASELHQAGAIALLQKPGELLKMIESQKK